MDSHRGWGPKDDTGGTGGCHTQCTTGARCLALDHFGMDDLDSDALLGFKERVNKRYPKQKYLEMSNEEFLIETGGAIRDRATGEFKIKRGTLLFLGKINAIREIYPNFHLDFFNRRGNNPRWIDRVSDDEPSEFQMNLYNFYQIVYTKLSALLKESFELGQDQLRLPVTDFDETIGNVWSTVWLMRTMFKGIRLLKLKLLKDGSILSIQGKCS